ncbi:hypothetical protein GS597_16630 [Synechococcales cyanobacterium C]|uniref:Uncharacterized protein n=1 Tax=Petrachloros mirabilis ULC683 TaxID=2781853 RepID=A0A8K2A096_9CYAN|nr:hypothetical protein [Petrachloros mirabilis]NCJ08103.1 hypothetical protein [Petrachloros mirabilis ULC683]
MTPTLLGRWQTRILLFLTVGLLLTLPFGLGWIGPGGTAFFAILFYLLGLGLGWDVLYIYLQKFRWDQDWPAAYQWLAALWEGLVIVLLFEAMAISLPGVDAEAFQLGWFLLHYMVVWVGIFLASQSLMRLLFLHWRFRGGQWL